MSVFYGWKIGALCLGGNFLLQGAAIYGMNAFMEPLCEINGWTRAGLNMSLGLAAFMGQASMPIAAAISTRYSLRALMALGAIAGGLATCAMGFMGDLAMFTVFLIILWMASQFCGGVVANALISNWFIRNRGVAFGLANSGASLSGMVLPFCCLFIIQHFGLTTAYLVLGIMACLLAIPSVVLVRRTPEMLHLHPDGGDTDAPKSGKPPANTSLRSLVRRPAAWYIGISFGLALMVGAGVLSQLKPRFSDMGLDSVTAMGLASVSAFFGTICKYGWGFVCDKTNPLFAARLLMLGSFLTMLLVFLPPSLPAMAAYAVLFAACLGGLWVVLPAVTAWYFGSASFLGVYRFIAIFILLRCLGFPVMGLSFDLWGNYVLADIIFGASLLLSFILTLLLREGRAVEKTGKA